MRKRKMKLYARQYYDPFRVWIRQCYAKTVLTKMGVIE